MDKFIATVKNQELREKFFKLLHYILARESIHTKLSRHKRIVRTLDFFKKNGWIRNRSYLMYILPYLSRSLSVDQKHQVFVNHYNFLRHSFSVEQLHLLFCEGMSCYEERDGSNNYGIRLKAITNHLEFEGSLNLVFECNGLPLYTLSFSFAPGEVLGVQQEQVIFIAAIQGTKNKQEDIRKATRFFKDNALPVLLMKALDGIAAKLQIMACVGVSASAQLSADKITGKEKRFVAYDEFWLKSGGKEIGSGYFINLPLTHKPIELISQNHRNRTIKKRNKSAAVYAAVDKHWSCFQIAS